MSAIVYTLPLLWAVVIHMTWFHSGFPCHLFRVVRRILPGLPWSPRGEELKYRDDWFMWVNSHLPPDLAELLTCPVCLSWHIAFWCSLPVVTVNPVVFAGLWPLCILACNLMDRRLR